jgi:hypothetical protein
LDRGNRIRNVLRHGFDGQRPSSAIVEQCPEQLALSATCADNASADGRTSAAGNGTSPASQRK